MFFCVLGCVSNPRFVHAFLELQPLGEGSVEQSELDNTSPPGSEFSYSLFSDDVPIP